MFVIDNKLLAWCESTCPGFCERVNGNYQCNCMKYPGFQSTDNGQRCIRKWKNKFSKIFIIFSKKRM